MMTRNGGRCKALLSDLSVVVFVLKFIST